MPQLWQGARFGDDKKLNAGLDSVGRCGVPTSPLAQRLSPAAVEPQPLLGVFAYPAFDDGGYQLRGCRNIDATIRVTRQWQGSLSRNPKATVRQSDHADAYDGTVELPCQPCNGRVGFAATTEEGDVHTTREMLIHQHAEMLAACQRCGHLQWRLRTTANQPAHQRSANARYLLCDRLVVRHPIDDSGWQAVRGSHHRGQFPIPQMRSKAQCRLVIVLQIDEDLFIIGDNPASVGSFGVVIPKLAEMDVFAGDAAEIFPGSPQCRFNPYGILIRKRGAQIGSADAMGRQQRTDATRHGAADVGRAVWVGSTQRCQQVFDKTTKQPIAVERKVSEHSAWT
ncbi:MAG TPA: hypothetical protein VHT74_21135 [Acetobacteraceae bacterium]|nr:hypothetical protein [Acetobacteraceae bacterium]